MKMKRNIQFCRLYGVQGVGCCFVLMLMDYSQIILNTCTPWHNRNVTEPKQSKQVYTKKQTKKKKFQILTGYRKIEK